MQKTLMAVAVAGALAAPSFVSAQTSTVQVGGSLHAFYYKSKFDNPSSATNADLMESSEPELFFRGEEALGGGLSAWFQCTSSLDGIITGASSITNSGWCARNSAIGFKGAWGNAFWGNWDAPQKLVTNRIRGWFGGTNSFTGGGMSLLHAGAASGTQNPTLTVTGSPVVNASTGNLTTASNVGASFFRRQASSFTYHSPVWSGFQVMGMFSAANETTGISSFAGMKPRMWSAAVHYDNGPLYLGAGYERHSDYNPANAVGYTGGDDDNWIIGAGYTFAGVFKLTGMYSSSDYETNITAALPGNLKAKGWAVYADWAISGPHSLKAQYARLDDTSGTSTATVALYRSPVAAAGNNNGAKVYSLFYHYALSKRTGVYGGVTTMHNDTLGVASFGKAAPTVGGDQTNWGVGVQHRF